MRTVIAVMAAGHLWVAAPHAATEPRCTRDDRTGVHLTVYADDLGLVTEERRVRLARGGGRLALEDVAAQVRPETLHVTSLTAPGEVTVLEQNFEYDLMNRAALLDRYVGRRLTLIEVNPCQDGRRRVAATLLASRPEPVYRIGDEIYLDHPGLTVLPQLPDGLRTTPTLVWHYRNRGGEEHRLRVSYLTGGLAWRTDYVLVLAADGRRADLTAWVSLDNHSGSTYTDAALTLVAGTVHRAPEHDAAPRVMAAESLARAAGPQFEERSLFAYHAYDLAGTVTVADNQTKQIRLFGRSEVGVDTRLVIEGDGRFWTRPVRGQPPRPPVTVVATVANTAANGLGAPLPAGVVRAYQRGPAGRLQFVGADRLDHTPVAEAVELTLGQAFDVVAERRQTDYRQIAARLHESTWQVVVGNRRDDPVEVQIAEHLQGNWEITASSDAYRRLDAFTVRFDVTVPAGGRRVVEYTVRIGL